MTHSASRLPLQIAATYIGTVVGAGFASGQEVLKFFSHYGYYGLIGISICTLLFSFLGTKLMVLAHNLQAKSHAEVLYYLCGQRMGNVLDFVITGFLLAALSVMLAGAGAVFNEYLNLPPLFGILITLGLAIFTTYFGIQGIFMANSLIVPLLTVFMISVSVHSLWQHGLQNLGDYYHPELAASPHWLLSALLYVAYNMTLTTPVLAPLAGETLRTPPLILGGVIGGMVLGLLAALMTAMININYNQASSYQVPLLHVIKPFHPIIKNIFTFILWSEIFTTVIGSVYGLSARLAQLVKVDTRILGVTCLLVATIFAGLPFGTLVGTVYPLLGYISIVFILALALRNSSGKG